MKILVGHHDPSDTLEILDTDQLVVPGSRSRTSIGAFKVVKVKSVHLTAEEKLSILGIYRWGSTWAFLPQKFLKDSLASSYARECLHQLEKKQDVSRYFLGALTLGQLLLAVQDLLSSKGVQSTPVELAEDNKDQGFECYFGSNTGVRIGFKVTDGVPHPLHLPGLQPCSYHSVFFMEAGGGRYSVVLGQDKVLSQDEAFNARNARVLLTSDASTFMAYSLEALSVFLHSRGDLDEVSAFLYQHKAPTLLGLDSPDVKPPSLDPYRAKSLTQDLYDEEPALYWFDWFFIQQHVLKNYRGLSIAIDEGDLNEYFDLRYHHYRYYNDGDTYDYKELGKSAMKGVSGASRVSEQSFVELGVIMEKLSLYEGYMQKGFFTPEKLNRYYCAEDLRIALNSYPLGTPLRTKRVILFDKQKRDFVSFSLLGIYKLFISGWFVHGLSFEKDAFKQYMNFTSCCVVDW